MIWERFPWQTSLRFPAAEGEGGQAPGSEVETEESEETEESSEEEESEESSGNDLDDRQLAEAKNLYQLLSDPQTRDSTLEILARKAGLLDDKSNRTPKERSEEIEEVSESILEILEKELGDNLKWMAPKFEKALSRIIKKELGEHSKTVASVEQRQIESETATAYDRLNRETKGDFKKLENRMNQLADKMLPSPDMSTYEYMSNLYKIASAEAGGNKTQKTLTDKINRNANNASERLGGSGNRPASQTSGGGKSMSLKEAVAAAAKAQK